MFLIDGRVCWSASDLTAAAECEYGVLRRLDVILGRAEALDPEPDAPMEQIGRLGDKHEARILQEMQEGTASVAPSVVVELSRAPLPYTQAGLLAAHEATVAAFAGVSDAVFQACFYDEQVPHRDGRAEDSRRDAEAVGDAVGTSWTSDRSGAGTLGEGPGARQGDVSARLSTSP